MEAKNLYANDFKKTDNSRKTSANKYHKRYVETGIMRLLTGYYPSNTCLVGYVLEGAVTDAVMGVNAQIPSILSPTEILTLATPLHSTLSFYVSTHNQNRSISHLMLQF